jgi:AmiR/NasT family two-component response regulator
VDLPSSEAQDLPEGNAVHDCISQLAPHAAAQAQGSSVYFPVEFERPLVKGGRPLRVLVVEDDRLVAMDHKAVVAHLGGEVVGETDCGEEAVCLAEDLSPDVVMMDVRLHGALDGIDAAELIALRLGIPIVFVTAYGDPATRRRMDGVGTMAPVLKPASVSQIRDAIRAACGF